MAGHGAGGLEIIDADRRKTGAGPPRRHHHRRNASLRHRLERLVGIAQRRRQDDAVDAAGAETLDRLALAFHAVALLDHQLATGQAGLFQAADQKFAQISGAGIGVEQADMHGVGAGQAARRQVGGIAQGLDRGGNLGAGGVAHIALAINHPRHRHRRHAGMTRDIMNGHDIAAAAAAFLGQRTGLPRDRIRGPRRRMMLIILNIRRAKGRRHNVIARIGAQAMRRRIMAANWANSPSPSRGSGEMAGRIAVRSRAEQSGTFRCPRHRTHRQRRRARFIEGV